MSVTLRGDLPRHYVWVTSIEDQMKLGPSHVLDYLKSETYRVLYSRHMSAKPPPPPQTLDKSKKASRARS